MSNVSIARIPHTGGNRKYTTWLFKKQTFCLALGECYSRGWQKKWVSIEQLTRWSLISARRCRGRVGRGGARFCWGWRTRPRFTWPFCLVYRYAAFVDQLKSKQKSVTESFIMHVYRDKKLEFERNIFFKLNLWLYNFIDSINTNFSKPLCA